jgi:LuxR family maltose regulon positive regulatory protein
LREGRSNKEIADLLFVAESTVKTHLKNIFGKLGVDNRTRAAALALESGIVGKSPVRGRREEGRGP